ncbi:MAG: hypothetical protein J0H55_00265 [Chitinophagaceae bacterium]|nr:hypothetical protein [Chitinophagaceae bacterium]
MKKHPFPKPFLALLPVIFLSVLFVSCKKQKDNGPTPPPNPSGTQLSDADSLKLLMYNYMMVNFDLGGRAQQPDYPTYYWYSEVHGVNPLSSTYPDAPSLLNYMKTFAKQPNGKPYDRYSFLDNGQVAGQIQQGVAGDLGMDVSFAYDANKNIILVVLYTDKNSPAGLAGVQRGMTITTINGNPVVYDGPNGPNVNSIINAVFNDPSATFTFKRSDGTTFTTTLSKAQYDVNPILFDTVYNINGKNVGYFVFYTFSNITYNNTSTLTKQEIDRVFSKFSSSNISDLIVDLRYNGGGSVNTSEYLDSLIAPSSVSGKVMYNYLYNDKLTASASAIGLDDKVLFGGGGSLNLDNVFFIGGRNTASASELTINNLKPYMNVKLVGDTTYGKPVGFFQFTISIFKSGVKTDLADLYAINFETRNANNQGGYFNGLIPDKLATDYVGIPWGDPSDANLQSIFSFISTGSYGRMLPPFERMQQNSQLKLQVQTRALHELRFNGMVSERASRMLEKK